MIRIYSWNQPVCNVCWQQISGEKVPVRLVEPRPELCAYCGTLTRSGIYVRANPETVSYPKAKDTE